MMVVVSMLFFFFVLTFVITRLQRTDIRLKTGEVGLAFAIKIAMGCAYGYVYLTFYGGDDTWAFHEEALIHQEVLRKDPALFMRQLWPEEILTLRDFIYYLLNDVERVLITRLLAISNFLTRGNYYANVVFFSFITFWGHYWLFVLLVSKFPSRRLALFIATFCVPTLVFWLSGIRGDGLLFLSVSLLLWQFHQALERGGVRPVLLCIVATVGVLIFRSQVVLVLIPLLAGWLLCRKTTARPVIAYAAVYAVALLLFFGSRYTPVNLPQMIASRQAAFLDLPANTRYNITVLNDSPGSYLRAAPAGLINTFARPFLWEAKGALQFLSAIESLLFLLFFLFSLYAAPKLIWKDFFIPGVMICCISLYLFIGITIPFPGAIIRYKAVPELLLAAGLVAIVRWKKKI